MAVDMMVSNPLLDAAPASSPGDDGLDADLARAVHEEEVERMCREQQGEGEFKVPEELLQIRSPGSSPRRRHGLRAIFHDILPTRHVPRVNVIQPSSPEEVGEARSRLMHRIDMYGLCERIVKGDGNCQFRALSDQLFRTPDMHHKVRSDVVAQLQNQPELYVEYVPDSYEAYCQSMAQPGTWGDHITLQAAADFYGVSMVVLTSYLESSVIEIKPQKDGSSERVLYISFWAEIHYNSLYPASEPPRETPPGRFLGSRTFYRLVHHEHRH